MSDFKSLAEKDIDAAITVFTYINTSNSFDEILSMLRAEKARRATPQRVVIPALEVREGAGKEFIGLSGYRNGDALMWVHHEDCERANIDPAILARYAALCGPMADWFISEDVAVSRGMDWIVAKLREQPTTPEQDAAARAAGWIS